MKYGLRTQKLQKLMSKTENRILKTQFSVFLHSSPYGWTDIKMIVLATMTCQNGLVTLVS